MSLLRQDLFSNLYPCWQKAVTTVQFIFTYCKHLYSSISFHLTLIIKDKITLQSLDCNYPTIFWQGVNLAKVIEAGDFICSGLHRKTNSKVAQARSRSLWRVSLKTMPEYMTLFPLRYCPCCCCLQICCLFCHVHHFKLPEVSYPSNLKNDQKIPTLFIVVW